jgi:hypothetical protein
MSRRKGESTGRINERDYPHIVELPLPPGGFRGQSAEIVAFHQERGIQQKLGRGRVQEGQWFVRYCFSDPAVAHAFRERFGGESLIAVRRPER